MRWQRKRNSLTMSSRSAAPTFFFSSRRRHTRSLRDWSSDVCSSDLDAEAKYFLSQFCELYYRRNRYTIQSDFARALYFLDGKLANGILDAYRKDDIIKKFLTNTGLPEVDVEVKKVALEEMQPPYKARVDFYMVYYSPDHTELKRDLYTANFVFVFRKHVPNELIPINPLGLTISYFREDQAFK